LCGVAEEEDTSKKKKGGERWRRRVRWKAIERGEFLVVYPLWTNNGTRGLLPSHEFSVTIKVLLPSLWFFDLRIKIYLFIYWFLSFLFSFNFFSCRLASFFNIYIFGISFFFSFLCIFRYF
jgi:hypothetical protein